MPASTIAIARNHRSVGGTPLEGRTHRPIFRGFAAESAVELADSIPELADSTTDFVIVHRLSIFNMFDIQNPLESADYWSQLTAIWHSGYGYVYSDVYAKSWI